MYGKYIIFQNCNQNLIDKMNTEQNNALCIPLIDNTTHACYFKLIVLFSIQTHENKKKTPKQSKQKIR